ncbi:hypothetical protein MUP01_00650 [Candidatus Bathyarchaeota archaeon]|nr:hypothetical protein [Candidatus Bathyarchaeota archaeon]
MTMRVETSRDDNGRLLKITIYKGNAKKVQLQFNFAQDEFIDTITFSGRREELPSASEIVALISAKFMERVQTLGNIEDALPTGTNSIGQVTANAGTNLNTSLLALEAGGNLAALVAKDYATQTTLALLKTRADLLATEATLATIHGHVDAIETDLALVHAHIGSIDGKITACNTGAVAGSLTQSTKHDAKTYLCTAAGSAADGATVINNVANKVIKIHRIFLQSTVDAATNVYLYEETSGNLVTVNTTLNAREGRESAFVPAPACIGQTTTQNKKVLLKNAAAKQVYWEIVYSADDAS